MDHIFGKADLNAFGDALKLQLLASTRIDISNMLNHPEKNYCFREASFDELPKHISDPSDNVKKNQVCDVNERILLSLVQNKFQSTAL